jgi:hypothetical protein
VTCHADTHLGTFATRRGDDCSGFARDFSLKNAKKNAPKKNPVSTRPRFATETADCSAVDFPNAFSTASRVASESALRCPRQSAFRFFAGSLGPADASLGAGGRAAHFARHMAPTPGKNDAETRGGDSARDGTAALRSSWDAGGHRGPEIVEGATARETRKPMSGRMSGDGDVPVWRDASRRARVSRRRRRRRRATCEVSSVHTRLFSLGRQRDVPAVQLQPARGGARGFDLPGDQDDVSATPCSWRARGTRTSATPSRRSGDRDGTDAIP